MCCGALRQSAQTAVFKAGNQRKYPLLLGKSQVCLKADKIVQAALRVLTSRCTTAHGGVRYAGPSDPPGEADRSG